MTTLADDDDDLDLDKLRENLAKNLESIKRQQYENKKADNLARNNEKSRIGRDIAPLPAVADPERRRLACLSLRTFCETYFADVFNLEWSVDQLRIIDRIESAIKHGGLRAIAAPRASGKTRLTCAAVIFAILTGQCKSVLLVAATNVMARRIFKKYIKPEFQSNELLLADFPEAIYPIWKLERNLSRAPGQHLDGVSTCISLSVDGITLPTVEGSLCSGSSIAVAGITSGDIRGGRYDLVLIDDPQTHSSAKSVQQCKDREDVLLGDILALAIPGKKLACLMTVTIIRSGDIADKFTGPEHPEWFGERMKILYSLPKNEKLWDEYREIQVERQQAGITTPEKENAFYAAHREEMDEGAIVAWPARHEPNELSGIQNVMNLRYKHGEEAFAAEYQNQPLTLSSMAMAPLEESQLVAKVLKGMPSGIVPNDTSDLLTAMVDVHDRLLYFAVVAWKKDGFAGHVVAYGTYPDQHKNHFSLTNAKRTLANIKDAPSGKDAAKFAGIVHLLDYLFEKEWKREDGTAVKVKRLHIDDGDDTSVVHAAIRQSKFSAWITPQKGFGIKASQKPMVEWRKYRGDKVGDNWRIPLMKGGRALRTCNADTYIWKSRLMQALATPLCEKGCLSFPKGNHKLLFDHILSERAKEPTTGHGRDVTEWEKVPGGGDNHFLDCLVGTMVAASVEGCSGIAKTHTTTVFKSRKKVTYCGEAPTRPWTAPAPLQPSLPQQQTEPQQQPRKRRCARYF